MLGPNGAGKTSLLKVLLGLVPLAAGTVEVAGRPPHRGDGRIGYIPQQRAFDPDLPMRGRDLVDFGLDGTAPGLPFMTARSAERASMRRWPRCGPPTTPTRPSAGSRAESSSDCGSPRRSSPSPQVLLCDEPLSSLDLSHQREVSALIDERRRAAGHGRRLRDPRDQPHAPLRQPRALPGGRTLGGRARPRRS